MFCCYGLQVPHPAQSMTTMDETHGKGIRELGACMSTHSRQKLRDNGFLTNTSPEGEAVTIDKGAKYKCSGASATPERKEHSTPGPTTTLLQQREQQRDRQLPCVSPHSGTQPPATPAGLQP